MTSSNLIAWRGSIGSTGRTSSTQMKELIIEMYREIKDSLNVVVNNPDNNLEVKLRFDDTEKRCSQHNADGNKIVCDKASVDEDIKFIADIVLKEDGCPSSALSFSLRVFGQEDSTLTVDINPDCECDCVNNPERDSEKCNSSGNLTCGVCECRDGFYGEKCECSKRGNIGELTIQDLKQCRKSSNDNLCSGNGKCSCGKCNCDEPYFGKYCECGKFENQCGCGENGKCERCTGIPDKCICNEGWILGSSNKCDCSKNTNQCLDPYSNTICNNNGRCECNTCKCEVGEGVYCQQPKAELYTNKYSCDRLTPCVTLMIFGQIVQESSNNARSLQNMKEKCDETLLKEQNRIKCHFTVNSTLTAKEANEIIELDQYWRSKGATSQCDYTPQYEISDLYKCTASFKGCPFFFYHNAVKGVDSYGNADEGKVEVYFTYINKTESSITNYNENVDLDYDLSPVSCPYQMPKWIIITVSGSSALFFFLSMFLAYFIIINIEERRQYREFKQKTERIFDDGNVYVNKLSRLNRASTYFRNRMSMINRITTSPSSATAQNNANNN